MEQLLNKLGINPNQSNESILEELGKKQMEYLDRLDNVEDEKRREELTAELKEIEGVVNTLSWFTKKTSTGIKRDSVSEESGTDDFVELKQQELVESEEIERAESIEQIPEDFNRAEKIATRKKVFQELVSRLKQESHNEISLPTDAWTLEENYLSYFQLMEKMGSHGSIFKQLTEDIYRYETSACVKGTMEILAKRWKQMEGQFFSLVKVQLALLLFEDMVSSKKLSLREYELYVYAVQLCVSKYSRWDTIYTAGIKELKEDEYSPKHAVERLEERLIDFKKRQKTELNECYIKMQEKMDTISVGDIEEDVEFCNLIEKLLDEIEKSEIIDPALAEKYIDLKRETDTNKVGIENVDCIKIQDDVQRKAIEKEIERIQTQDKYGVGDYLILVPTDRMSDIVNRYILSVNRLRIVAYEFREISKLPVLGSGLGGYNYIKDNLSKCSELAKEYLGEESLKEVKNFLCYDKALQSKKISDRDRRQLVYGAIFYIEHGFKRFLDRREYLQKNGYAPRTILSYRDRADVGNIDLKNIENFAEDARELLKDVESILKEVEIIPDEPVQRREGQEKQVEQTIQENQVETKEKKGFRKFWSDIFG